MVEPFGLEADFVGVKLFRVHRGQLRKAGGQACVETAGTETVGIAKEHAHVVVDPVFRRQVIGPGFPGLVFLTIAIGADTGQRHQWAVGGDAGQLGQVEVDVFLFLGPAQATGHGEVIGEVVGQVAE